MHVKSNLILSFLAVIDLELFPVKSNNQDFRESNIPHTRTHFLLEILVSHQSDPEPAAIIVTLSSTMEENLEDATYLATKAKQLIIINVDRYAIYQLQEANLLRGMSIFFLFYQTVD